MRCFRVLAVSTLLLLAMAPLSRAQVSGGGVYIDPSGTLKARQTDHAARLKQLKSRATSAADSTLGYISLPRAFAEARKQIEAGKPLTDELRYLQGLTRVRYVFVYPAEQDLVIAGPVEPVNTSAGRAVGKVSGRPVIHLDDVVTALRSLGPGARGRGFGCSIDLTSEQLQAAMDAASKFGAIRSGQRDDVAAAMARAAGPQQVRVFGIPANTRLAMNCVEADYLLKRLALGLDKSPVADLPSYMSVKQRGDGAYVRWWFETRYEPLLVSPAGDAFGFRGQSLEVNTSSAIERNTAPAAPSAQNYARTITQKMPDLAAAIPAIAELQNAADLALLAALIANDKLHEKAGWDLSWVMSDTGYVMASTPTPTTAETLVAWRALGGSVVFGFGGVTISPGDSVNAGRSTDEKGELAAAAVRPADGWFTQAAARKAP